MTPMEMSRLDLALKASNEGIWEWRPKEDFWECSDRVARFLHYPRGEVPNFLKNPEEHCHPDDLHDLRRKLDRVFVKKKRLLAVEPRLRAADGTWHWMRVRGVPVRNEEGEVVRLVGSVIDISKRKRAEAALAEEQALLDTLLENIPMNVYFKDRESRFVKANTATARKLGEEKVKDIIGRTDHDFFDVAHADLSRAYEQDIMRTREGQIERLERETWSGKEDTWVLTTKLPWFSPEGEVVGTFGVTNDVTELIEAQKDLKRVADMLHETNQRIEDERHLLRLVIDNVPLHVFFKDQDSRYVLVNQSMARWLGFEKPEEVVGKCNRDFLPEEFSRRIRKNEQRVMEAGEPLLDVLQREPREGKGDSWKLVSKFPWRDAQGRVKGTFGVSSDVTSMVNTQRQLAEVARDLKRRNEDIEAELNMAREIQQSLIPGHSPVVMGAEGSGCWAFSSHYEPASELAGDSFDWLELPQGQVGFLIFDVMGHGVRSALIVSMLRGLCDQQERQAEDPGLFLSGLNEGMARLLDRCGVALFATALYGVIDVPRNELRLALAGHPAPLVRDEEGVQWLEFEKGLRGPALGLMRGAHYGVRRFPLDRLRQFVAFTDGLYEVSNEAGEGFGRSRVEELFQRPQALPEFFTSLMEEAKGHAVQGKFSDDVCLIGFEWQGHEGGGSGGGNGG